jgi:signal transduction histidine kinase
MALGTSQGQGSFGPNSRVEASAERVGIEVIDAGAGFDLSESQTAEDHGLRNMAEPAQSAGATLSLRAFQDEG